MPGKYARYKIKKSAPPQIFDADFDLLLSGSINSDFQTPKVIALF